MNCPLCNSPSELYAEKIYALDGEDYDLRKCRGCGVVFVDPFPPPEKTAALYGDEYFERDYSFGIVEGNYLASEVVRESEYRRILGKIARLTDGRNLLEVGCAAGAFLKEARGQGWNTTGVDISPWAVRTAREKFGLDVREGTLGEQDFPAYSFDAVFFGDLFEHLPEPLSFLDEVRRVVKPHHEGGVVVAKVPTYLNSFYYRWLRRLARATGRNRSGGRLSALLKISETTPRMPPYHLFEYNPASVRWVFRQAGLEVFREDRTLMIPEMLHTNRDLWARSLLVLFKTLKFLVESFGLHGGHVYVFAASSKQGLRP